MSRPTAAKTLQPEPEQQAGATAAAFSLQSRPAGPGKEILALQRMVGNRAVTQLLQSDPVDSAYDGEELASHFRNDFGRPPVMLQTKPADGQSGAQTEQAPRRAEKASQMPVAEEPARALIVEDDTEQVQSGQMRKSEFLSQLRTSVCSAAEEALKGTIWSAMGCPYIERWFRHYSEQDSQHVERALHMYAPETAGVRGARDYIPIITQRVRRGIAEWARTGEITGVPEEVAMGGMPGVTPAGLMGGLVGGALSAVGSAVSGLVGGVGGAIAGIGRMLFKRREGGAGAAEAPEAIRGQLRSGQALDSDVRARMQTAYGVDFSRVRVHTDGTAQQLSERLHARAFTIGSDIAFGAGEYQPGTLIGDALIAHELAHVVQQGSVNPSAAPMQKGGAEDNSLEEDADVSAVGAVVSVWGGMKGTLADIGKHAMPRLRSGLRLQGCASTPTTPPAMPTKGAAAKPVALTGDWKKDVQTAKSTKDEDMMVALVKLALGTKYEVRVAKKTSTKKVVPKDYEKLPIINFDVYLNDKERPTGGAVGENAGLHFKDGTTGDKFAILGPNALAPASPLITRMYADHESYLAEHALEKEGRGRTSDNDELRAWTLDFTNYFHQFMSIKEDRPTWTPLLDYYAAASAEAKKESLEKLKGYYNKPAVSDPKESENVKNALSLWVSKWKSREGMKNRKGEPLSKGLIDELDKFVKPYTR